MTLAEIAGQIAALVDRQAAAVAENDLAQIEALTGQTGRLLADLDARAAGLSPDERRQLAELLQPAAECAQGLTDAVSGRLDESRKELQELRQGRSVATAYRQSMPKQAAISYSRQG